MSVEERRRRWLAVARVSGAVAAGVARRFAGERLDEAFAGGLPEPEPDERPDWKAIFAEARARLRRVDLEIAAAERAGARLLDCEDEEYPPALRGVSDPPPVLFVRGTLEPRDARAAAVIGSRECTRYGVAVTRALVPPLVARGVTIVSGMARGIDATAHRAALAAGGRTIAVLGTGIDVPYPGSSRDLYEEIPRHGAIVSEVAPGTLPMPWVFPPRNRILSGLATTVVIVEARRRSGTAVTARHALDQGREVGVVPGDVDVARSAGTNAFLTEGAYVVRGADDVMTFGFREVTAETKERQLPPAPPPGLDPDAQQLWSALVEGAATLEELVGATRLAPAKVMAGIGRLERVGLVRGDGWGRYETARSMELR